jgi:hypothetical protein
MRAPIATAMIMIACSSPALAVIAVNEAGQCNDRNALQSIAYDARLIAVKMYYEGLLQNMSDKNRQVCVEAHVLMDDAFAVINKTRTLVEANCLPIDVAAKIATEGLCP